VGDFSNEFKKNILMKEKIIGMLEIFIKLVKII
jgi:hypothetical protein